MPTVEHYYKAQHEGEEVPENITLVLNINKNEAVKYVWKSTSMIMPDQDDIWTAGTEKALSLAEEIGEPFMQREMRVMDMADEELRKQSWKITEETAVRSLGSANYAGMLSFVKYTLADARTEGENGIGMHKLEFGYTRFEHTKRVLGWAKRLYDITPDKTGLRYEDLMIATIFHDIGRAVSEQTGGDHAKADRKSTRLNSSHLSTSRMPSSA